MSPRRVRTVAGVPQTNHAVDILTNLADALHLRHNADGSVDVYGTISAGLLTAWRTEITRGDVA